MDNQHSIGSYSHHGKVYIPQTMVDLSETKDFNISTKSTKDQLKEAGLDYEESRRAALEYEKQKSAAALAKDLRPEVAGQTNIEVPLLQLGVGSAVIVFNINPPIYGIIRWIGTMPQVKGYIAGVELVSGIHKSLNTCINFNNLFSVTKHMCFNI